METVDGHYMNENKLKVNDSKFSFSISEGRFVTLPRMQL